MFRPSLLLLFVYFFAQNPVSGQMVFSWPNLDRPPLFSEDTSVPATIMDSVANRRFLESVYGSVRAPAGMWQHWSGFSINVAVTLVFHANGELELEKAYLFDLNAKNAIPPMKNDVLLFRVYTSSHPDKERLARVKNDAKYRKELEQRIYQELIPTLRKSLLKIPTFQPAIKNGKPVTVKRTLIFKFQKE